MADLQPLLPRRIPQSVFPPIDDTPPPIAQAAMGGGLQSLLPSMQPDVTVNNRIGDSSGSRQSLLEADLYKRENPIAPTTTLGKIGHVASGIGNALGDIFAPAAMALIPGTELHSKLQEDRDTAKLEDISKQKTEADQRKQTEAATAYTQQRPAIEQAKILQKLTSSLAPKGIKPTMNADGTIDTEDDTESQAYKNQQALQALHNGTAEKEAIQSEIAQNHYVPGTPEFAEAQRKLAQVDSRLHVALAGLGLRRESLGLTRANYMANNLGVDEQGKPLPGAMVTDQGNPVGAHFSANARPTGQERNKADMANSAEEQLSDVKSIMQKHPTLFGPGYGQTSAFKQWLGSEDPDAQRFLAARTIAADHLAGTFGGRSEAALDALDKAIGQFKDNPTAAVAGIDQLTKANTRFENAGAMRTVGSNAAKKAPTGGEDIPSAAASQLVEGQQHTFNNGQVWTKKDGKPVRVK